MISKDDFIKHCEDVYLENPSKFGFAFWKYRELIYDSDIYLKKHNNIDHYYAINKSRLVYYWAQDYDMALSSQQLSELDLLYLHNKYEKHVKVLKSSHEIYSANALIYDINHEFSNRNDEFYTEDFDFNDAECFDKTCWIINNSSNKYSEIMNVKKLRDLMKQPVFDPNLWVLIKDRKSGKTVGVGIGIYDAKIREVELEWIYVHKDYHARGAGKVLILEGN